ncbi:MAG: VanZ family protein [Bacillaceae bacterium]|nr:VanZ family protein [Bacillaceae bacterium]
MTPFVRWIPSLIWMAFIFYMSSRTGADLQSMFPMFEQFDWGHFAAYFILALLYYLALSGTRVRMPGVGAVVMSVLYGITDEWHQMYVETRTPELGDLILDFVGAASAVILLKTGFRMGILSPVKKVKADRVEK